MTLLLSLVALSGWICAALALCVGVRLARRLARAERVLKRQREELEELHIENAWFAYAPERWTVIEGWLGEDA
jgi:uncharacterized protein involved in response to NO